LDRDGLAGLLECFMQKYAHCAFADAAFFRKKSDGHEEGIGKL
jgi:hypothetical protein